MKIFNENLCKHKLIIPIILRFNIVFSLLSIPISLCNEINKSSATTGLAPIKFPVSIKECQCTQITSHTPEIELN